MKKKLFSIFAACLLLSMMLPSCGGLDYGDYDDVMSSIYQNREEANRNAENPERTETPGSNRSNSDTEAMLLGKWVVIECNLDSDLIFETLEFFADGTVLLASSTIREFGPWSESQTWKADNGRLILTSMDIALEYDIIELSDSTLTYESYDIPVYGHVRATAMRQE
jgi:hypothetical protein